MPAVTTADTVLVPVKTGLTDGFEVKAVNGASGALLYTLETDYSLPPHDWTPPYGIALSVRLAGALPDPLSAGMTLKSVGGGYLLQTRDNGRVKQTDLKIVTKRAPTPKEIDDMLFAFTVCKHVKSNAIVYAKDGATVGVGAGQMNRRDSSRIAAIRAAEAGELAGLKESPAIGSVVASDAFFPFADGLLAAAEAGATAIIQPGGSMRDKEVIEAADEKGLAMVFTGMRHFRH